MNDVTNSEYPIRLNVYLARAGIGSRRACDRHIEAGEVKINGKRIVELGTKVEETDEVRFRGAPVEPASHSVYLALNKPPRVLCSSKDPEGRPLAIDFVRHDFSARLFTVGRLDFLSCGLVLISNDGEFAQCVMHPSAGIEKEYLVETKDPVPEELLKKYTGGLYVDGEKYKAQSYRMRSSRKVSLTLIEGKNREIRRVFQFGRIKIKRLRRVRIGPVNLKGIPQGGYRHLSSDEVRYFMRKRQAKR